MACDGAAGSVVTVNETSLEASTQDPKGRVGKRTNAFIFDPFSVGVAIIESTAWPLSVQVYGKEISVFSQALTLEITGAFRSTTSTESE